MTSLSNIIRDELASDTLDRIYRDRTKIDYPKARDFFTMMADHLFDHELSVTAMYSSCGLDYRKFVPEFRKIFRNSPSDYLKVRRLEIGERLLVQTPIQLSEIAELIGLGSSQTFSEAFTAYYQERPSAYRSRTKNSKIDSLDKNLWDRTCLGELTKNQAQALQTYLNHNHPDVTNTTPIVRYHPEHSEFSPQNICLTDEDLETLLSQKLWFMIQHLPMTEQINKIRKSRFKTRSLYHFLRQKASSAKNDGTCLARLALEAAICVEPLDNSNYSLLWAQAWAWLGNAQRLVFDLKGADRSFTISESFMPPKSGLAEAEVLVLKSALRWYQHEFEDGIRLQEKALPLIEKAGDIALSAKSLHILGHLYRSRNDFASATAAFTKSLARISTLDQYHELELGACYNIALCLWEAGETEEATENVADLRRRLGDDISGTFKLTVDRLEGRILHDQGDFQKALKRLSSARAGLKHAGSALYGLVSFDLAITCLTVGDSRRALRMVDESLPIVSAWRTISEFDSLYAKVEHASRSGILTIQSITCLRDMTVRLSAQPNSQALLNLQGFS